MNSITREERIAILREWRMETLIEMLTELVNPTGLGSSRNVIAIAADPRFRNLTSDELIELVIASFLWRQRPKLSDAATMTTDKHEQADGGVRC